MSHSTARPFHGAPTRNARPVPEPQGLMYPRYSRVCLCRVCAFAMAVRDGAEKRSHGGRAGMKTLCNSRKEGGLVSKEDAEYGKRRSRKAAIHDESRMAVGGQTGQNEEMAETRQ